MARGAANAGAVKAGGAELPTLSGDTGIVRALRSRSSAPMQPAAINAPAHSAPVRTLFGVAATGCGLRPGHDAGSEVWAANSNASSDGAVVGAKSTSSATV